MTRNASTANLKAVIEASETGKMSNKGTYYFKGGKMVQDLHCRRLYKRLQSLSRQLLYRESGQT